MSKKRGVKLCPKCETENGVRAYECKNCDHPFKMKKPRRQPRKKLVEDFKSLRKGDIIQVVGGSGDYFEGRDGERQYYTDRGKYTVVSTDSTGIRAFGPHGYTYLYMGKKCKSKLCANTTKCPHKILLVTPIVNREVSF